MLLSLDYCFVGTILKPNPQCNLNAFGVCWVKFIGYLRRKILLSCPTEQNHMYILLLILKKSHSNNADLIGRNHSHSCHRNWNRKSLQSRKSGQRRPSNMWPLWHSQILKKTKKRKNAVSASGVGQRRKQSRKKSQSKSQSQGKKWSYPQPKSHQRWRGPAIKVWTWSKVSSFLHFQL